MKENSYVWGGQDNFKDCTVMEEGAGAKYDTEKITLNIIAIVSYVYS
jgi:hypothetical protein